MEVQRVLHMNKGDDDASYAKNSSGQKLVIMKVKHFLVQSIEKLFHSYPSAKCIRIADLGCSSGPNALVPAENMIESIHKVYHKLGHKPPSIEVFLNDLEGNDFNNVFRSLSKFYDKLEKNGSKRGSCFVAATPGSFYGRLFPDHSTHFIHSSYSIHWLSQVPRELEVESGRGSNKRNICYTVTSPPGVHEAFLDQFRKDFTLFLRMRSTEMVPQGHLFLTLQGKMDENDSFDHWVSVGMTLNDMVMQGMIEEANLDAFNIPFYGPSMEELRSIIENENSFNILSLETFKLHWDDFYMEVFKKKPEDNYIRGEYVAASLRAILEPILTSHFGDAIMDEFFRRLAKKLSEHLEVGKGYVDNLVVSLGKK
ncbi:monomethylxanthine methyltransferase 2-like [Coffea eugenioides]|uniref:monomethylxanthine methyltransferase 2-like n=1 Tax=Coffea eugenioides TaxID=49369 RepID=UPI000F608A3F|nr:monomethylxanthine methyltransferase 2-like [Coffea eugenioides]